MPLACPLQKLENPPWGVFLYRPGECRVARRLDGLTGGDSLEESATDCMKVFDHPSPPVFLFGAFWPLSDRVDEDAGAGVRKHPSGHERGPHCIHASLAIGSYPFGHYIDQIPSSLIKTHAFLEIGLFEPAFLWLLEWVEPFYMWLCTGVEGNVVLLNLVRFTIYLVLIAIPTEFMGATLPVLVKQLVRGVDTLLTDRSGFFTRSTQPVTVQLANQALHHEWSIGLALASI